MPTLDALEIEGHHEEADGMRLEGVMQPTLTRLLIRRVRTAVHITGRARNVIISHCHIYHNTGVGVHLDRVNLHQTIITGSHISYCRLGGIRIDNSEIRNLQITGNDIEYNNNDSAQGARKPMTCPPRRSTSMWDRKERFAKGRSPATRFRPPTARVAPTSASSAIPRRATIGQACGPSLAT